MAESGRENVERERGERSKNAEGLQDRTENPIPDERKRTKRRRSERDNRAPGSEQIVRGRTTRGKLKGTKENNVREE